ncbi:TPA: hypothetical protein DEP34_01975 [Candidatus Uhrbacteria bacterium]|nr:hypothetical protein [Candidatus Uhrbacteria bacterium]HCB19133.1 hypothetical protein [Candidatus Uhrbacteria bacterium]
MDSVSSARDSLPEQYRAHFETLRQEIINFTEVHGISRESLGKPDLLREVTGKLSIPYLERLALLLERFEYLLKHKEPKEITDPLEYAEEFYHLREQYNFQVELLEQVGILKEGSILGIDSNIYPIPTLEQIAMRLFEHREKLSIKHDQGFTKLLLVPFGMSLDSLQETFKQFLLDYAKKHPDFPQNKNSLLAEHFYVGADAGGNPRLVYNPGSFPPKYRHYQTKEQILDGQLAFLCFAPGWRVLLLQSPADVKKDGFASIPLEHLGTTRGSKILRPDVEAHKTADDYLHLLLKNQDRPDSPYEGESGMTPEDWILAYMIHLSETGEPLDRFEKGGADKSILIGAYFLFKDVVPTAFGAVSPEVAQLGFLDYRSKHDFTGSRFVLEV